MDIIYSHTLPLSNIGGTPVRYDFFFILPSAFSVNLSVSQKLFIDNQHDTY